MEEFWTHTFADLQKKKGTLIINDEKYEFFGWGPWVAPWEAWYDTKMATINSDVRGYNKEQRWDEVGELILSYGQQSESNLPTVRQVVKELMSIMQKPDKEPIDPSKVQEQMEEIYRTLKSQVLDRLMPDAKIPDSQVPIVWSKIREHVILQQTMAISFLDYSEDLAGITSKTIADSKE